MLYNRALSKKGNKHNMLDKQLGLVRIVIIAWLAAFTAPLVSASEVPKGLTAEQVSALEKRVRDRWQLLSANAYGEVYEFFTPVYRTVFPKELYVLQFSYAVERELTGIEVVNYDAAAAVASVTVRVMSKPLKQTSTASQALGAIPVSFNERWMLIDGQWWYSADA
ncbi:MAG: hypothetical protein AAF699_01720 [Pseudomonadota bacterium]